MSAIKEQAKALIEELPDDVVRSLLDFLERLQEWEATREILEDEEFSKAIEQGLHDIQAGRTVEWRAIKRTDV
jgi:hypothetical protein